jgi:hypothetical protein
VENRSDTRHGHNGGKESRSPTSRRNNRHPPSLPLQVFGQVSSNATADGAKGAAPYFFARN